MQRGIVMIAMGDEYERLAANTLAVSLKNIKTPVTVIFNREDPVGNWFALKINKIVVECETDNNREIKTQLYKYSPYGKTLYVDVDAVFQKEGIETIFDLLNGFDFIFQKHSEWKPGKRYYALYKWCMKKLKVDQPLSVYIGGFFVFRKGREAERFFDLWHSNWKYCGYERDMPALACALKTGNFCYRVVQRDLHGYFSFGINHPAIVVHRVKYDDLTAKFNIPAHQQNKLYSPDHWKMVFFDEADDRVMSDPWVIDKFDKRKRTLEVELYIQAFLIELKNGGLSFLDIAAGPGELMLAAIRYGCTALGIEATTGMLNRREDLLYERYSVLCHIADNLNIIYADFNTVMADSKRYLDGKKFDVINCKHAINFILNDCFDFILTDGVYKNKGSWRIDEQTGKRFYALFSVISSILNLRGVFLISALKSVNSVEYSVLLKKAAAGNGFSLVLEKDSLIHKFCKMG
jgi:hypothetical protein